MDGRSVPRALFVALALALGVTALVAGATSSTAFGAYNPGWDGVSDVRAVAGDDGVATTVVRNVSGYDAASPNGTVALVLSPTTGYTPAQLDRVERFVRAGGTLVVAEDYGPHGNGLLAGVGAEARIDGRPLRDEEENGPGPAFPTTRPAADHPLVDGVDTVELNHGSVVATNATGEGTAAGSAESTTVLLASSSFGYLDVDRDEELDDEENLAVRPVATVEPVGEGRVVAVADPSAFLNAMLERADNRRFLRNAVAVGDRLLLDVSHGSVPPLTALRLTLVESGSARFLAGTATVVGLGLLAVPLGLRRRLGAVQERLVGDRLPPGSPGTTGRRGPDGGPPELTREELATALRTRHPEWSEERVGRLTDKLIQRDTQATRND